MKQVESGEPLVYHIYFDSETDCVVMEWNGYANSSEFRTGTEKMLSELVKHKTSKVLADIKNMVLIAQNDQSWLIDYFIPKAVDKGFKAIAIIKPDYYFNKVALETIAYKVNKERLEIQFFDKREDARDWLTKK